MSSELDRALDEAVNAAKSALALCTNLDEWESASTAHLGRKSSINGLLRQIATLPPEQRGPFGKRANEMSRALTAEFDARKSELLASGLAAVRDFDPSTPGIALRRGHEHPVLALRREVEDVFVSMGFRVQDGPEVETEAYNFEALNIPSHHPARDFQDTFWVDDPAGRRLVLRTHTSPMQVRAMRRFGAPLRVVVPGRVYRNETADATHESAFHQVEGLVVDRGISVAHLKGVMAAVLGRLFGSEVAVRLRPHYFPFVEPGFELDFQCRFCAGAGCSVCKGTGWIELLGCGLVHAHVLRAGGIDPEVYSGFAFGLGLDRLTMMRHGVEDIRHFHSGDLRFFEQF